MKQPPNRWARLVILACFLPAWVAIMLSLIIAAELWRAVRYIYLEIRIELADMRKAFRQAWRQ